MIGSAPARKKQTQNLVILRSLTLSAAKGKGTKYLLLGEIGRILR